MAASNTPASGKSVPSLKVDQELEQSITNDIKLHVTALDVVVSVNSFFTAAVFIGLSLSASVNTSLVSTGADDPCNASPNVARRLVVFEVISFSCYLMSSLIAQGLKLQLAICSTKKDVQVNPKILRVGMLATAAGSIIGTVFLTLSMIGVIEIRLGLLTCSSVWSKAAAIPLIVLVSIGVFVFVSTVLYAFLS